MPKYYGNVGYAVTEEESPGVWVPRIIERTYTGDVTRNIKQDQAAQDTTNDDITLQNQISIVADAYAYEHFYAMKYVWYMGVRWKVKSVEVATPRLHLSIGGVYNGPEAEEIGAPPEVEGDP